MDHSDIIRTVTDATRDEPAIRALFLSGSYANGMADDFSDIDFVMLAPDGASDDIARIWRKAIGKTGDIVLWWDRTTVPVLINAITSDWTRTDVIILKPDQIRSHTQSSLIPLFDHDNIYDDLAPSAPKPAPNLKKFSYQIEEFIRILGLLHLAVGRKEYINGVLGVFHLRNMLVDLLIEETDAPHRGGILHLNRLISKDQQDLLLSLPPAIPDKDAMIAAHLAYAQTYLPRARARAARLGMTWPEPFEAATWAKLNSALSIERPYTPQA